MLSIIKSSIEKLESAAANAKSDLHKVRSQHEAAAARAAELANKAADAFADLSPDADAVEEEHAKAALREKSLSAAISRAEERLVEAEQALAAERARVAREASAARCRDLAKAIEKAKPAAAEASRKVADVWGSAPANIPWSPLILEGCNLWLGSAGFFEGDFLDLAIKTLRQHADLILSGERPADLGRSFDEQALAYGRPPIGLKKSG